MKAFRHKYQGWARALLFIVVGLSVVFLHSWWPGNARGTERVRDLKEEKPTQKEVPKEKENTTEGPIQENKTPEQVTEQPQWRSRPYPTCAYGSPEPFSHNNSGRLEVFSAYLTMINDSSIRASAIIGNPGLWTSVPVYAILTVSAPLNDDEEAEIYILERSASCSRPGNFRVECSFLFNPTATVSLDYLSDNSVVYPPLTIVEVFKFMAVSNTSFLLDLRFEATVADPSKNFTQVRVELGSIVPRLCEPFSGTPLYHLSYLTQSYLGEVYLHEWLTYHLMVGYQHFFIYDDGTTDNTSLLLQPFIDAGLVTYVRAWTGEEFRPRYRQFAAMEDWLFRFSSMTQYVSQADDDCYFMPMFEGQPIMSMTAAIERLAEGHSPGEGRVWGQYQIGWALFGSSGLKSRPPLMTQAYRMRHKQVNGFELVRPVDNRKIIVRNSITKSSCIKQAHIVSHYWTLQPNCSSKAMNSDQILIMVHYYIKSYEDFVYHSKSGWSKYPPTLFEQADTGFNDVEDTRMFYYGSRLRELMNVTADQLHLHLPHLYSPQFYR